MATFLSANARYWNTIVSCGAVVSVLMPLEHWLHSVCSMGYSIFVNAAFCWRYRSNQGPYKQWRCTRSYFYLRLVQSHRCLGRWPYTGYPSLMALTSLNCTQDESAPV